MIVAVIPARYNSKRYPGKSLVKIGGKPMLQHLYKSVEKAIFLDDIIVATDHIKIIKACEEFKGKVVYTSTSHVNGTSRCLEAVQKLYPNCDNNSIIINIQGDQLSVKSEQLSKLIACFKKKQVKIATLKKKITDSKEILSQSVVKVESNSKNMALKFYREVLDPDKSSFFKHIGIYAFRYKTLKQVSLLEKTKEEKKLSLEQLRWLANSIPITVVETEFDNISIDIPEDLKKI